ncbi:MAG TPA: D-alanyl-D-alanine carboxypeptidase family protein [Candidatus Binatia bacterium]|nr:D-alanyl-D-alanine carboxypeptidase family protein [Candidatus Binatia bacterium]
MMRWTGAVLMLGMLGATAMAAERAPARAKTATHPARASGRVDQTRTSPQQGPASAVEPHGYYVLAADTGTELGAGDPDKQWPPASMTKMMTVLLALEQVRAHKHSLTEPVHVSARAATTGGSQVYLKAGETFSLGELLSAVMIPSANDAAVAVAEHLAGSTEAFVRRMNARARGLGMTRTVYHSPNGLPPEQGKEPDLSTARDLAHLARRLMQFPEALQWSGTVEAPFRGGTFKMHNTNHLLTSFAGATGLKTGHYGAAGFSVTGTATRGDLTLVAVVLGAPSHAGCFDIARRLLGDAFDRYRVVVAARPGVSVGTVPVTGGAEGSVKAIPVGELRLVVPRADERQLVIEPRIPRSLFAPVLLQQQLGEVVVRRGDEALGRVKVVADAAVDSAGWLGWLWPGRFAQAAR